MTSKVAAKLKSLWSASILIAVVALVVLGWTGHGHLKIGDWLSMDLPGTTGGDNARSTSGTAAGSTISGPRIIFKDSYVGPIGKDILNNPPNNFQLELDHSKFEGAGRDFYHNDKSDSN
jgi:hypothetical protein